MIQPATNARDPHSESRPRELLAWALPLVPLGLALLLLPFVTAVARGETFQFGWAWVPSLDVNLSFHLDGLSLLFAVLITGIGTMIFTYAPAYLGNHPSRWRLYSWLMLFMASMLGVVLANNTITLFVFWELTSITSYFLIGFEHEKEKARLAALQALLVTGFGGLLLLAGLLLLGHAGNSYELSTLVQRPELLRNSVLLLPSLVLILLGAFAKSAQFPFHFWLPNAMEAPTPVSAYLHSATMVKAGVYLVARLSPAFEGIAWWDYSLVMVGTLTALTGGFLALQQTDLKRILAYSTVSALGTLMLLLGIGTPLATKAAVIFLICHSLYKAAMFLVAGTIDHCTGTRDSRRLAGLAYCMPMVAVAAALAALSKAGLPPTSGFLAKEVIYESLLPSSPGLAVLLVAVFLVNTSFVAVACLLAIRPFFGRASESALQADAAGWGLALPPLLLASCGVTIGLLPNLLSEYVVGPAVIAIDPNVGTVKLKLWHGFNLPLLLSVLTLLTGSAVYASCDGIRRASQRLRGLAALGPAAGYESLLAAFKSTAAWQTNVLQNGRLRTYLLVVFATLTGVVAYELVNHIAIPKGTAWLDIRFHELFLPALILAATIMAIRTASRLAAVCALGVIGYAVAMLFVMFGAPDLAMTQLAIETLTVILFVFVIYRLPRFATLSSKKARVRDAIVAIIAGGVMSAVVLAATAAHAPSRLSQFYAENSLAAAKGKNMVNVILVDFRGLDTLGEITVLTAAGLGIFTLMRLRMDAPSSVATEGTSRNSVSDGPVLDAPADVDEDIDGTCAAPAIPGGRR